MQKSASGINLRSLTPERKSVQYPLGNRNIPSSNPLDSPQIDPRSRYSITYVPNMSEHQIDTGKNLMEAQFKVILLACEVERLSTLNYQFVKENEILRVQANKSQREKDLETKLAIVLAENEKLNQVIEEISNAYPVGNEDTRIQDLLRDLEDWKRKYNILENQTNVVELQNQIKYLTAEKERLNTENALKDRENQALRERLNDALNKKLGDHDSTIRALIDENNKLKQLVKDLERGRPQQIEAPLSREEIEKRAGVGQPSESQDKLRALAEEVAKARQQLSDKDAEIRYLRPDAQRAKELDAQLRNLNDDYNRIRDALRRAQEDNENLRRALDQSKGPTPTPDQDFGLAAENERLKKTIERMRGDHENVTKLLKDRVDGLLQEIAKLQEALGRRVKENEDLSKANRELIEQLEQASRQRNSLGNEIDLLRRQIAALTTENNELKSRIAQLNDANRIIDELNNKIRLMAEDNQRLASVLNDKSKENEVLAQRLRELQDVASQLEDLRGRLILVTHENERLSSALVEKGNEIEGYKRKIEELQKAVNEADVLRHQLVILTQENDRLNRTMQDKIQEIEALRRRVSELEQANTAIDQLNQKIRQLLDEIQRLNDIITQKNKENESLVDEIRRLKAALSELDSLKSRNAMIADENEKLRHVVMDRMAEIDDLNKQLETMHQSQGVVVNKLSEKIKSLMTYMNTNKI